MPKMIAVLLVAVAFMPGCQAPSILLSPGESTVVKADDYDRLWAACRAVIARQFEVVSESQRDGRLVAMSRVSSMVSKPNADPSDSRTVATQVTVAILSVGGGYEAQVRAQTRGASGPDFGVDRSTGLPQLAKSQDFDRMGTAASRDYALEEQIRSQIQAEMGYAPPAPRPKR